MTDLDLIRRLIFSFPIPGFARGVVNGLLTEENIRRVYKDVGEEKGVAEVFAALVRIGQSREPPGEEGAGAPRP